MPDICISDRHSNLLNKDGVQDSSCNGVWILNVESQGPWIQSRKCKTIDSCKTRELSIHYESIGGYVSYHVTSHRPKFLHVHGRGKIEKVFHRHVFGRSGLLAKNAIWFSRKLSGIVVIPLPSNLITAYQKSTWVIRVATLCGTPTWLSGVYCCQFGPDVGKVHSELAFWIMKMKPYVSLCGHRWDQDLSRMKSNNLAWLQPMPMLWGLHLWAFQIQMEFRKCVPLQTHDPSQVMNFISWNDFEILTSYWTWCRLYWRKFGNGGCFMISEQVCKGFVSNLASCLCHDASARGEGKIALYPKLSDEV